MILNLVFTLSGAISKSDFSPFEIINKSHHKFKDQNSQNTETGALTFIETVIIQAQASRRIKGEIYHWIHW